MASRKTKPSSDIKPVSDINDKDCTALKEIADDPIFISLSPREKRFIYYLYVQNIKALTNADTYRNAYNVPDMDVTAAAAYYHRLIRKDKISILKRKIDSLYAKRWEQLTDRIIEEETHIAFSDIANFFDAEGHLTVHPSKLPEEVRRAISSIKAIHMKNGSTVYEVTLWNKGSALARLQNIFGMAQPTKYEISGPNGNPIEINHKYDFTLLKYEEKRLLIDILNKCRIE